MAAIDIEKREAVGLIQSFFKRTPPTECTYPARLEIGGPVLGNLLAFARQRLWVMERAAAVRGGICELALGFGTLIVVSSPDLIHEVFVSKADAFEKGTSFRVLRPFLGNGLLTSENELHRRQRKLMAPPLAHKRLAGYADAMADLTERRQGAWLDGGRIDVGEEMMRLTLAIVTRTMLGAEIGADAEAVGSSVSFLVRYFNTRISLRYFTARISTPFAFLSGGAPRDPRVRSAIATLDAIIQRFIDERRANPADRGDMLSMLLAAREEGTGARMSDRQIRDEVMTLFVAGHETTANGLAWALYLLSRHPEVKARLRAEATSVLGGRVATAEDLPRLGYALQVLKEAMRLYPPAYATSRQAIRDVEIGGQQVARGTNVIVNIHGMHRRAEYFPDPERFDPERFDPAVEKDIPRGAYLPFGAGARVCIGNHFAMMEGQIILATLAQRVDLTCEAPGDITPAPLVTLRPEGGVPMRVRRL